MHFTVVSRKGEIRCLIAPAVAESPTKTGKYLQGHEQKLRKQLEEKVGGLPLLASLVKVTQMYAQDRDEPGWPGPPGQADLPKGLTGRAPGGPGGVLPLSPVRAIAPSSCRYPLLRRLIVTHE